MKKKSQRVPTSDEDTDNWKYPITSIATTPESDGTLPRADVEPPLFKLPARGPRSSPNKKATKKSDGLINKAVAEDCEPLDVEVQNDTQPLDLEMQNDTQLSGGKDPPTVLSAVRVAASLSASAAAEAADALSLRVAEALSRWTGISATRRQVATGSGMVVLLLFVVAFSGRSSDAPPPSPAALADVPLLPSATAAPLVGGSSD
eukprot:4824703-Prymnesium_polylepis.1